MYQQLTDKKIALAVIGLGYVGLPVALEFAKKLHVIGFDTDARRIALLRKGIDPSREQLPEAFTDRDIVFTSDPAALKEAGFFIIAVPTLVDKYNVPDLKPLL